MKNDEEIRKLARSILNETYDRSPSFIMFNFVFGIVLKQRVKGAEDQKRITDVAKTMFVKDRKERGI